MAIYPVRKRLPPVYSAQIGRFITQWALLESQLRKASYTMLRVDPKIGRLMVREPRVVDYVTMIEDAMELMNLRTTIKFPALKDGLGKLEGWRDKVAHGVWVKHTTTKVPVLQELKGTHPAGPDQGKKARIHPKAREITVQNLRDFVSATAHGRKMIERLVIELMAQFAALPCRCCGQPLPRKPGGRKSRSQGKPSAPPLP